MQPSDPIVRPLLALLPGSPEQCTRAAADLLALYAADGRFYHTLAHVQDVLGHLQPYLTAAHNPVALQLAAWFHDAIYDPRRHDNEAQSAAYATAVLANLGAAAGLADETARLIRLTEKHETAVADSDGRILLDADLAVLAAEPSRYDAYAQAIRREYAHISAEAYRQGRTAVLQRLLAREQLYFLPAHGAWEIPARLNLRREMARLSTMS